jgi:hypothetical protein
MSVLEQLPLVWRQRANFIRPYAEAAATAYDEAADQLVEVLRDRENELLNLRQASKASGYSADYLGRLLRDQRLHNHGRRGAPKLRRGDLPLKRPPAPSSPIIEEVAS